ncbi:MAG: DNA-formamidopyrimidine glycosylase [Betaproteobacteria bacterium CG2_30_68_42]|nr:MAG: DNA-formamidopyrimidine glycosylase [Betaproteobacteria bacterium CG2_30_68_42]
MPELPEVEVTRRGLDARLAGSTVTAVTIRDPRLRFPVPSDLPRILDGQRLRGIERRGKYLLFGFARGTLIAHLGMSGSLRLAAHGAPHDAHERVEIAFGAVAMRLRDPRRFGLMLWTAGEAAAHPLIAGLGIEPLGDEFDGSWLFRATRGRTAAIKSALMDSHLVVGIGNVYAAESLFRAGIRPLTPAGRLSRTRCGRLAAAVRETLDEAIRAGGSSLRDYVDAAGTPGCFQLRHDVYGRAGEPCRKCGTPIRVSRLAQRSSFHCPRCQR